MRAAERRDRRCLSTKPVFINREMAAKLWPALITAQHSDKQSVDDLLRDIGIKFNRYYQVRFCTGYWIRIFKKKLKKNL